MRASIVRISIPISDTRTKASMTRPLSRITSTTSASPLGRGRSRYPPVGLATAAIACFSSRSCSGLAGRLGRHGLLGSAHQLSADVRPVLCQRPRDAGLANAVQVADHPIELLERVLRRLAVAVGLLLLGGIGILLVVASGHQVLRRLPAA